jgi:hypothetical protein
LELGAELQQNCANPFCEAHPSDTEYGTLVDRPTSIERGCCKARSHLRLSIKSREGDPLNSNPGAPLYDQFREAICTGVLEAAGNSGSDLKKYLPMRY